MNKFVVFAVLAVCAFAESIFPVFENYHQDVRDDDVVLTPHELPCAYGIEFHQDASVVLANGTKFFMGRSEGHYLKHDSYFKLRATGHNIHHNNSVMEVLLRSDIREGDNVVGFSSHYTYFNHTHGEGQCERQTMTLDEMNAKVNEYLRLFVNETKHQKKESGTFEGHDCTVYIDVNETAKVYVALFVNSENYIIGANYTAEFDFGSSSASGSESSESGKVMVEMIAHVHYRHFAPVNLFVLHKNHSIGCDEQAYIPPEKRLCYAEFQPAPLPCAFEINIKTNVMLKDVEVASGESTYYVHDKFYGKLHSHGKQGDVDESDEIVVRSDLVQEGGNITVFIAEKNETSGDTKCETVAMSKEDVLQRMSLYLRIFTQKDVFDVKETREFKGKNYTAYVEYFSEHEHGLEGEVVFYVDENNRIVAIEEDMPYTHHEMAIKTSVMTYKDDAALTDFVIDKDIFAFCNDSAYVAPTENKCIPTPSSSAAPTPSSSAAPTPSSSTTPTPHSSSMASSTVAAVAMVLLSVVVALL